MNTTGKSRNGGFHAVRMLAAGIGIVLLTLSALALRPTEARAEKVNMMMSFLLNGRHSWYFSVRENGLYKKAGLEVTIRRGFGGADTVKKMAAGAAEFCETDLGNIIIGRTRGANLKMVSIYLRKAPFAIMSLQKTGITKPKDLEGRRHLDALSGICRGDRNRHHQGEVPVHGALGEGRGPAGG